MGRHRKLCDPERGSGESIYLDKEGRRCQHGAREPSKGSGVRVPGREW